MNQLDHVVLSAPDLENAMDDFEKQTGRRPVVGGSHRGLGTRNALISFGSSTATTGTPPGRYLEILSPDPNRDLRHDGLGRRLSAFPDNTEILHYAVRTNDLRAVQKQAKELGFLPRPIVDMSRQKPDGTAILKWKMLFLEGYHKNTGGLVPFFIDWCDCAHPTATPPVVGQLTSFAVCAPAGSPIRQLLRQTDGIPCREGEPKLEFTFQSPGGNTSYVSTMPPGFVI